MFFSVCFVALLYLHQQRVIFCNIELTMLHLGHCPIGAMRHPEVEQVFELGTVFPKIFWVEKFAEGFRYVFVG